MLVSDPDLCCLTFTKDVKKVQPSSYPSTLGTFEKVQSDCDYYLKDRNFCDHKLLRSRHKQKMSYGKKGGIYFCNPNVLIFF